MKEFSSLSFSIIHEKKAFPFKEKLMKILIISTWLSSKSIHNSFSSAKLKNSFREIFHIFFVVGWEKFNWENSNLNIFLIFLMSSLGLRNFRGNCGNLKFWIGAHGFEDAILT
jgi:hypothetical protein